MAKIGCKFPCFKPSAATAGIVLGKLNKADLTVNMATGELYGDDQLVEKASEFASGTLAMETTALTDDDATALFGHTAASGKVTCNIGDTAPAGKLAYYRVLMRGGVKYYKAFGYPNAKAVLGNESDQTKNNTITFSTENVTFDIMPDDDGNWREFETFDTETAAETFVKTYCTVS